MEGGGRAGRHKGGSTKKIGGHERVKKLAKAQSKRRTERGR